MRKSRQFAVVLVAALGLAGAAQGAVLTSASISISPYFDTFGAILTPPPITATGAGTSLGLGATATLGGNILVGSAAVTGITSAFPITRVVLSLTGHAPGSFTPSGGPGGGLGGAMAVTGGAIKYLGYSGLATLTVIPIRALGQPGGYVTTRPPGGALFQFWGTGWTTGVATVRVPANLPTPAYYITYSATGADSRTASGAGTLNLISPLYIWTNPTFTPTGLIPTFASLTLNYVPEPGTLLLVGVGIAGLALRGRKRHRPS
jgi:hypothetical protein